MDYIGGSLGKVDVRNLDPSVPSPQAECERRCRLHGDCHVATYYPDSFRCGLWKEQSKVSTLPHPRPVYSFVKCGEDEEDSPEEVDDDEDGDDDDDDDDSEDDGAVQELSLIHI